VFADMSNSNVNGNNSIYSILKRAFSLLDRKKQIKLIGASCIQILTAGLDLIGVALIGILGALTIQGIESGTAGNRVSKVLNSIGIENLTLQMQVTVIGVLAILFFVFRTILTVVLTRKSLRFLSFQAAIISGNMITRLLSQSVLLVNKRSSQKTIYILNDGVHAITMGFLGSIVTLIADGSLLIVMSVGLFFVDPMIAFETLTLFTLVGMLIYALLNKKASSMGRFQMLNRLEGNEQVTQVLHSYREILVRGRREFYSEQNRRNRADSAQVMADSAFLPSIGKYMIEATVLVGTFVIGAIQFARHDAVHATATMAIFLAAGSRIAPAVLRLQQSAIQIKNSVGAAEPAFELIEELGGNISQPTSKWKSESTQAGDFSPEIRINNLNFTYPGNESPTIRDLTLQINPGEFVAFVGPSGAGKTSLVDLILGVLEPDQGSVLLSGHSPLTTIEFWPGSIGYVPQDVVIINGSIRDNIAMGFAASEVSEADVISAIAVAQLEDLVASLPKGVDTQVGERGTSLSGGQRQRLGIARAMYTKPKLLVLDEATSSLDGETESAISRSLEALAGEVTVVIIAHRLSTVRTANTVYYLEGGQVQASGNFEQVRKSVKNFDEQAKLMGL
jgi:ABC-type multidrug transport system fused ATPase/permease subunit